MQASHQLSGKSSVALRPDEAQSPRRSPDHGLDSRVALVSPFTRYTCKERLFCEAFSLRGFHGAWRRHGSSSSGRVPIEQLSSITSE